MQFNNSVFSSFDAQELLKNKYVLFIGDSVIRGMYKDVVKLLQKNEFLKESELKSKGEFSFENDDLLEGGQKGLMSNDPSYTEIRVFCNGIHLIKFYFITRCYSDYLRSICSDISKDSEKPDVVIMNSGCWDLTRYGPNSVNEYKRNLPMGIYALSEVLPSSTVFIWTTVLPLAKTVRGGFMLPDLEISTAQLRQDVLHANHYAANIINEFKLDTIDLHYYFKSHIHLRAKDGIHWNSAAHRCITTLIFNHLCDSWRDKSSLAPGRIIFKQELEKAASNYCEYTENDYENDYLMNNDFGYHVANNLYINDNQSNAMTNMYYQQNQFQFQDHQNILLYQKFQEVYQQSISMMPTSFRDFMNSNFSK